MWVITYMHTYTVNIKLSHSQGFNDELFYAHASQRLISVLTQALIESDENLSV